MKIINAVAAFLSAILITYLFSAFVAADFNIANWDAVGRLFVAMIAGVFSVSAFNFAYQESQ